MLVSIFFSCKKSSTEDSDLLRLTEVRNIHDGVRAYTTLFTYDDQARVVKVEQVRAGEAATVLATISYRGNEMIMLTPEVRQPDATIKQKVIYTLNEQYLPLRRLTLDTLFFGPPNVQRDYNTDTIDYTYDASGLLVRKTGRGRDSSWSSGGAYIQIETRQLTGMYTNTNGNLTSYEQVFVKNLKSVINGSVMSTNKTTYEEAITYDYTKKLPNKIDPRNAIIFSEFVALLQEHYPWNSFYRNSPNGYSASWKEKDANNTVTDSRSFTNQPDVWLNKIGYIEKIVYGPTGKNFTEFIYTK